MLVTVPETTIASENRPSQKEIHLPTIDFQAQAVSFLGPVPSSQQLSQPTFTKTTCKQLSRIRINSVPVQLWFRFSILNTEHMAQ